MSTRPAHVEPVAVPHPVRGSAQPPRGLSGALRRLAYTIPEHRARRPMLLILADRIDVLEHRAVDHPALALTAVAGILATLWLIRRS
jgi:hypothetical protein